MRTTLKQIRLEIRDLGTKQKDLESDLTSNSFHISTITKMPTTNDLRGLGGSSGLEGNALKKELKELAYNYGLLKHVKEQRQMIRELEGLYTSDRKLGNKFAYFIRMIERV